MNQGLASTHDAVFPGFTLMAGRPRIMQIEASQAAAAAVLEMLLHTRRGVLHIFPAVPRLWDEASFSGVRAEGAFLVSAWRERGQTAKVVITSEAGAELVLRNPWAGPVQVTAEGRSEVVAGEVLRLATRAGEVLTLTAG